MLFACFVGPALLLTPIWSSIGPADRQEEGLRRVLALPGRRLAGRRAGRRRAVRAADRRGRPDGRRVRRLPGLPDGDDAGCRGDRRSSYRLQPGGRLHRRVDRRGDLRPRARPGRLRRGAAAGRLPLSARRRRPARLRRDGDRARASRCCPRCWCWSACGGWPATGWRPTWWKGRTHELGARTPAGAAGRRPAGARRADAGLRLRLRARRGRPGRPRGGGGVRRLQRPRPDRLPEPAADGERPGRLRRQPARRAAGRGGHGHLRRHRVGAARGAGGARQPPRRVAHREHRGAVDRARGVPQGCALLRGRAPVGAGRRGLPRRPGRDGSRRSTRRRAPCWWWSRRPVVRPRRGRPGAAEIAAQAAGPRDPLPRRRVHRRLGARRTPPASAATCRRGRSRSRASRRSRSTCTSTPTPQGHLGAAAPLAGARGDRSTSRTPAWPGYTMLNSTMQSTKSGGPLAGAWAVLQTLGDDGYAAARP